jgi:hypothetical protein
MARVTITPERARAGETFVISMTGLPKTAYVLTYEGDSTEPMISALLHPASASRMVPIVDGRFVISASQQRGTYRYDVVLQLARLKSGKLRKGKPLASATVEVR